MGNFSCLPSLVLSGIAVINTVHIAMGFEGKLTEYGEDTANQIMGTCGFQQVWSKGWTKAGRLNVAMNPPQFENGANCGRCIKLKQGNHPWVYGFVNNLNPPSPFGEMDSARAFYAAATENGPSNCLPITWNWAECPTDFSDNKINFWIDKGAQKYWFPVMPQNFRNKITKVEMQVDGKWYDMKFQGPNFRFIAPWGVVKTPYVLRSTMLDGSVYTSGQITSMAPGTYVGGGGTLSGGGKSGNSTADTSAEDNQVSESTASGSVESSSNQNYQQEQNQGNNNEGNSISSRDGNQQSQQSNAAPRTENASQERNQHSNAASKNSIASQGGNQQLNELHRNNNASRGRNQQSKAALSNGNASRGENQQSNAAHKNGNAFAGKNQQSNAKSSKMHVWKNGQKDKDQKKSKK